MPSKKTHTHTHTLSSLSLSLPSVSFIPNFSLVWLFLIKIRAERRSTASQCLLKKKQLKKRERNKLQCTFNNNKPPVKLSGHFLLWIHWQCPVVNDGPKTAHILLPPIRFDCTWTGHYFTDPSHQQEICPDCKLTQGTVSTGDSVNRLVRRPSHTAYILIGPLGSSSCTSANCHWNG